MSKHSDLKKENIYKASQKLQVSEATIQNWLKAKLLKTLKPTELELLKNKLASGEVNKLNKRANKRLAHQSIHFHPELLRRNDQPDVKIKLDLFIIKNFNDKNRLLLAIYLNLLEKNKFLVIQASSLKITNSNVASELKDWPIATDDTKLMALAHQLKELEIVFDASVLAYVYQSSSSTGEKNIKGAYYTPQSLISSELKEILKPNQTYCDPCCGGGAFLVEAYKQHVELRSKNPEELVYGFDLDKMAVLISRANLTLLSNGQVDVLKQVRCINAITENLPNKFDVIATNPPWGAEIAKHDLETLQKKFDFIKSQESFSYFLAQSMKCLKLNATLSFILPESVLSIKTHQDIRKHLFKNYQLHSVKEVSEKFSGVMTKVIALKVVNAAPNLKHQVQLITKHSNFYQQQENFQKNSAFEISLNSDEESVRVLSLIEKNAQTSLKNNAEWGLGIVTGNNAKYLKVKASAKTQAVVKGVDICRFQLKAVSSHLLFEPNKFQQIAPIEKYRTSEKLVYRFICKELVFAIDRKKQLTLNSANFVMPKLKSHSLESLCGLFNSKLAQYYFQKKYNTFKVLRYHIESFPIAYFDKKQATEFDFLVRMLEKKFNEVQYEKLNQLVYEAYKLDKAFIAEIEKTVLSKAFIK